MAMPPPEQQADMSVLICFAKAKALGEGTGEYMCPACCQAQGVKYAFTPRVNHTDGSSTRYQSRERVKLALDPETKAPIAVFSAVRTLCTPWADPRCKCPPMNPRAPFCDNSMTHMQAVSLKSDDVARTPPMGFVSWQRF